MTIEPQLLKLEGVYQQQDGRYMQRVKLAGGIISVEQAELVVALADRFAGGMLHLTTRGSIELHGIAGGELPEVSRQFARVGLTGRGACGGAVRGISCSTTMGAGYPLVQTLVRKLHQHFTQNPHFEGLPKKFKIGVEAQYEGGRHLIQDVGLVLVKETDDAPRFDVWVAGGLGKEPQPAFLLQQAVPEAELFPLLEDIVRLYKEHAPKGRRLKHLIREIGQDGFQTMLERHRAAEASTPLTDAFDKSLTHPAPPTAMIRLEAAVFAGQLTSDRMRDLIRVAREHADGFMVVTSDQNIAMFTASLDQASQASAGLGEAGFTGATLEEQVSFRICPGNHECRMGLAPTRDLARKLINAMGPAARHLSWAISGCHNSCSQPQLADVGIFPARLVKDDKGHPTPLFTMLRRTNPDGLGQVTAEAVPFAEVMHRVSELS